MSSVDTRPTPDWLLDLLGLDRPRNGQTVATRGTQLVSSEGILRVSSLLSDAQAQTSETFGFKWNRRATFESEASRARMRRWLIERYGDVTEANWWHELGSSPLMIDAGCGAGLSAIELFGERLRELRYLGLDISSAVDVAAARFRERGLPGAFLQAAIDQVPLPDASADVIFSEGVLHHTDSTQGALVSLARVLREGGRFLFYVYRRKGPIREFTDDFIRERLQAMEPDDAWQALEPLTALGRALGELGVTVRVPRDVELLDIPAGEVDLQRLFYWHVFKAYYDPELDFDELNHINYDWYAPRNAHRQTVEQVRGWCVGAGLTIERENVQQAGITIVARKSES